MDNPGKISEGTIRQQSRITSNRNTRKNFKKNARSIFYTLIPRHSGIHYVKNSGTREKLWQKPIQNFELKSRGEFKETFREKFWHNYCRRLGRSSRRNLGKASEENHMKSFSRNLVRNSEKSYRRNRKWNSDKSSVRNLWYEAWKNFSCRTHTTTFGSMLVFLRRRW